MILVHLPVNIRSLRWPGATVWETSPHLLLNARSTASGEHAAVFLFVTRLLKNRDRWRSRMSVSGMGDIIAHRGEALTAVDGASLARVKRNRRNHRTMGTLGSDLDPLPFACCPGDFNGFESAILCFFTVFAAFRRILKLFIAEKYLFADGPHKFLRAIYALNIGVRKFGTCFRGGDLVS